MCVCVICTSSNLFMICIIFRNCIIECVFCHYRSSGHWLCQFQFFCTFSIKKVFYFIYRKCTRYCTEVEGQKGRFLSYSFYDWFNYMYTSLSHNSNFDLIYSLYCVVLIFIYKSVWTPQFTGSNTLNEVL